MGPGSQLIPFPSSVIHLTQPAIVDPAFAGRWVCLQILNTTQGTFPLSFLGQVIPLYHVTAAQWVRAHPLHYPPLHSPPNPCHVPPRYITRFASVTEWTKKKKPTSSILPLLHRISRCESVWACVCVCVSVCVYVWLWCRMMGIAARPCQRDISQSILSSSSSSSFAPSFLPPAAFPQALRSNIKKMAALGGSDCQFSAVSYGNSCWTRDDSHALRRSGDADLRVFATTVSDWFRLRTVYSLYIVAGTIVAKVHKLAV